MLYSDSLKSTCNKLDLSIPFEEGEWPSFYLGPNAFDFRLIQEKLALKGIIECKEDDFNTFKKCYFSQRNMKHNLTDLCILFADWVLTKDICNGCSANNYFWFNFHLRNLKERKRFVCLGYSTHELTTCNDYALINIISNKNESYKTFHEFIHRKWIDLSISNQETIKNFLLEHKRTVLKPSSGSKGNGVKFLEITTKDEAHTFAEKYSGRFMVLEEALTQESSVAAFNTTSINTIRICTFKGKNNIPSIICSAGRFGKSGNFVDNFSNNGIGVTIDVKSGLINSDGIDTAHNIYKVHPNSGKKFRGFQYPHWEKVRDLALKAASLLPEARHIGWDISINPDGTAELIEGNLWPGFDLMQAPDQKGKMPLYKNMVDELKIHQMETIQKKGFRIHNLSDTYFRYAANLPMIRQIVDTIPPYLIDDIQGIAVISSLTPSNIIHENLSYNDIISYQFENIINSYTSSTYAKCFFSRKDVSLIIFSLEYIKEFSLFLTDICRNTNKQIIIICRPLDKEEDFYNRWIRSRFILDFTENWLKEQLLSRGFKIHSTKKIPSNPSAYIYNFIAIKN